MLYYSKFYFVHNTLRNSTFYQYYTLSILPILHIIQLKHKWTTTFQKCNKTHAQVLFTAILLSQQICQLNSPLHNNTSSQCVLMANTHAELNTSNLNSWFRANSSLYQKQLAYNQPTTNQFMTFLTFETSRDSTDLFL